MLNYGEWKNRLGCTVDFDVKKFMDENTQTGFVENWVWSQNHQNIYALNEHRKIVPINIGALCPVYI